MFLLLLLLTLLRTAVVVDVVVYFVDVVVVVVVVDAGQIRSAHVVRTYVRNCTKHSQQVTVCVGRESTQNSIVLYPFLHVDIHR